MKRKLICAVVFCLGTILALPGSAFAEAQGGAAAPSSTPSAIVADMTFQSPAIKLTLSDAYKKMETSPVMELLKLQKTGDQAAAAGASETMSKIKRSEDLLNSMSPSDPGYNSFYWGFDNSNKAMVQAQRDYAHAMVEPNNEARLNGQNKAIFQSYYGIKGGEASLGIAKDGVKVQEDLLKAAQAKFKAGAASKMDVLNAEIKVKEAKDGYTGAQNKLNEAKMEFNISIGYPLMQGLVFTDELTAPPLPTITLEQSIKDALSNRIKIKEAAYNQKMAQLAFNDVSAYPPNSSKYLNAKHDLLTAQILNAKCPSDVEADVRAKYMAMNLAYQQIQSGKQSVANAKESARLAQLQYDAGMITLTDVQGAQLGSSKAQQDYADALLAYNLALEDYRLCSGVGVISMTPGQ